MEKTIFYTPHVAAKRPRPRTRKVPAFLTSLRAAQPGLLPPRWGSDLKKSEGSGTCDFFQPRADRGSVLLPPRLILTCKNACQTLRNLFKTVQNRDFDLEIYPWYNKSHVSRERTGSKVYLGGVWCGLSTRWFHLRWFHSCAVHMLFLRWFHLRWFRLTCCFWEDYVWVDSGGLTVDAKRVIS